MPNVYDAEPTAAANDRYAIVVARWNEAVTGNLVEGAIASLTAAGVSPDAIDVAWTPGAWEIPVVTQRLADTCRYAAILTLGAVIKGETAHDHWINHGVTEALMRIATEHSLPVLFGVLMCDSMEQAINRAGGSVGNKGAECAEAALKMVGLLRSLPKS
ncbi:6,7-dimethyl-8-ribityllumazine synthase [Botrimarina hoheduenensis]|uniref:6,7-dimethyl-8-ribityllumazine synthase n=1 Tax=Botrimarina hoheduenensis TaxID=2528000 RepID=A0A5C5WFQ9_9BACT|nr:6,7-dimethyl-8-ribityllumazine synthase [Botrimarina hoheduenensis]TWT48903.1 6,7-dimethyl-8-ribityllumazine synthase [Botrimarina hoheduenensis]